MVLSVPKSNVSLVMAGTAERTKILFIVCPTTGQRKYMMYLRCYGKNTRFKTVLTERVSLDIVCTNLPPTAVVLLDDVRVTAVLIVLPVFRNTVFIAVPTGGQPRTSGVTAGL